jgi:hypothetical protein
LHARTHRRTYTDRHADQLRKGENAMQCVRESRAPRARKHLHTRARPTHTLTKHVHTDHTYTLTIYIHIDDTYTHTDDYIYTYGQHIHTLMTTHTPMR